MIIQVTKIGIIHTLWLRKVSYSKIVYINKIKHNIRMSIETFRFEPIFRNINMSGQSNI